MRLFRSIAALVRELPADARLTELLEQLPKVRSAQESTPSRRVLVQCVGDPYFLGLFSSSIAELSKRQALCCDLFVLRSVDAAIGTASRSWVRRAYPHSGWIAQQWVRVYRRLMGARVGYRSVSWAHPWMDLKALMRAWIIWRKRPDAWALESLHAEGVRIGDLVIDTYLRFRPAATIEPGDSFLLYVLWQAFRDAGRATRYFKRHRPALYLSSFTSYVQHGIAARIALRMGTPVVSFGNLQQMGKELRRDDYYQTKNPMSYRDDFVRVSDPHERLDQARQQLEARLNGGIDAATIYMARSAYASQGGAEDQEVDGMVIVFMHDFFDSPHIYADLVFPDFWLWACCTIDTLLATARPFAVKPHPNQVADSAIVIERLKQRYPTVKFLDPGISNAALVAGGMRAAVTVYGTVVHELAYMGIPSIACARHPHAAFDFCTTARNRDEYVMLLHKAHDMYFSDPQEMRRQVLVFYAMHNLEGDEGDQATRTALVEYWRSCTTVDTDANAVARRLDDLRLSAGFQRHVDRLERLLLCGADTIEESQ